MHKGPLVSVIIPTHNRFQKLKRAVESVLAQDYANIELVVVDDGSRDETWTYLNQYASHESWVIARNEVPMGACAARNRAIRLANGEFIANLDDDDFFAPNRISRLLPAFQDGAAAVTSHDSFFSKQGSNRVWKKKAVITSNDLLYRNRAGNSFLTKKSYLLEIDGFDESLRAAQDHDVFLRLAECRGTIVTVPMVLHHIDEDEESARITTSSSKWIGYYDFYGKHKAKMNGKQRRSNLYIILKSKGKGSLKNIVRYAPFQFWPVELIARLRRLLSSLAE